MASFPQLVGYALIAFAVTGPLAYCAMHVEGPVSGNALALECIKQRGVWKADGAFSPNYCHYPEPKE